MILDGFLIAIATLTVGLLAALAPRGENGTVAIKSGIMGIILIAGGVHPGDRTVAELPREPHENLKARLKVFSDRTLRRFLGSSVSHSPGRPRR